MEGAEMTLVNLPINFTNIKFIVWVALNRAKIRFSQNTHPFNSNFISGDAFRSLADHVYEGQPAFDVSKVYTNDIVFVGLPYIHEYLLKVHPRISADYRLISHNGDVAIDQKLSRLVDSKIQIWWTQNCVVSHPKIKPIPIGIENLSYFNHGIPSLLRLNSYKKKPEILYGFSISTNPKIRGRVHSILKKIPKAVPVPTRLNSQQYFSILNSYMFVASPPGNGEDCMRTWEAMYLKVIPIVQRSVLATHFERMKLPLWVIDDWSDLKKYSSIELEKKYYSIMKKSSRTPLHFDYWRDSILHTYGK